MPDNSHHCIQLNADYEMSNVISGNMVLMQGRVCREEGGGGGSIMLIDHGMNLNLVFSSYKEQLVVVIINYGNWTEWSPI